jgi:hypothetical protein
MTTTPMTETVLEKFVATDTQPPELKRFCDDECQRKKRQKNQYQNNWTATMQQH